MRKFLNLWITPSPKFVHNTGLICIHTQKVHAARPIMYYYYTLQYSLKQKCSCILQKSLSSQILMPRLSISLLPSTCIKTTNLPVSLKSVLAGRFISIANLPVSSLYRSEKEDLNAELSGKFMARFRNFECIITFNHRFFVFNVCCGPHSMLMPSAWTCALTLDLWLQQTNQPVTESYIGFHHMDRVKRIWYL